ncbi:DUF5339 domain-containing protein [Serratia fonticola]|uniref:DUF5339 domain-containing protein n=1 Tax=Serratia fonticola TaxID=47917 RepID=UPI0015C59ED2|nr:DUF5339 domain-containing protein [Serratia fonticola]MBC3381140.1 DUF5339 domain-containing protein [Serratia fonticola]NYA40339.1 DUF5339 domain-containing protein [Serratia fonticola]
MKKFVLIFSMLAMSSSAFAGDLTETCKKYVGEVDDLIVAASKNEAAKPQMDALKAQMDQAKKQIASMPAEQQESACKQGSEMMGQMKASMGLK